MNGIIFHIEEDAYEALKVYMTGVKRHFAYTSDSEEIVTDIENRIAEMFSELLETEKKQVIVRKDVELVTAQMGSVSDFAEADEETIGEVPFETARSKKLFRDLDERVVGGVCAGIAHYFSIDVKWIRLIMILLLVVGGTAIVLYPMLWIIIPKAVTRAEKMAMKGEKLTLQNFKRNFDEETAFLKDNFTGGRPDSFGNSVSEIVTVVAQFVLTILKFLLKVISVLVIVAGILALVAAFIALFALFGYSNQPNSELFPFIAAINPEYRSGIYFSAFVLVTIPLIALVLLAIRVVSNYRIITRTGSFALLVIWLTGIGTGIYYGTSLATEFAEEATFSKTIDLAPSPVFVLKVNDSRMFTGEDSVRYQIRATDQGRISIYGRRNRHMMPDMELYIERSDDATGPTLTERLISQGPNFDAALRSAQKIDYRFTQTDSVLKLDWSAMIAKHDLWRGQRVRLVLRVPKNTRLIIDGELNSYLRDYNLRNCLPDDAEWETPSEWIMTDQGMTCKNDSLYRANTEN